MFALPAATVEAAVSWQLERTMERLEKQLEDTDDPSERKAIMDELRDIQRELADEERWRDEGRDRGWT